MKIQQKDLSLSFEDIEKYFELHDIRLAEQSVLEILERTEGNGLYIKIIKSQILWQNQQSEDRLYVLDENIWLAVEREMAEYLEHAIYEQWDVWFLEFFYADEYCGTFQFKTGAGDFRKTGCGSDFRKGI